MHACVITDNHSNGCPIATEYPLRDGLEIGNRNDGQPSAKCESLGDARRETHAGEAARAPAERNGVEVRQRDAGLRQ